MAEAKFFPVEMFIEGLKTNNWNCAWMVGGHSFSKYALISIPTYVYQGVRNVSLSGKKLYLTFKTVKSH